ncbi:GAD-like domain-containing protein [Actinomyces ruminis]|uniref:GAD-related domain-containing protein n=1 Tax=Actinomyces ruminis TaxID=1937003 RepID=A0ABX4MAI4_9ACTO|nr:GAD-like domain-containing protein [Actinomyces ruminis]PHP52457.1 hypothetical protein BW737_009265 [Actinomyces ruminis]
MDDGAQHIGSGEEETDPADLWDLTPVSEPSDPVEQDALTEARIQQDLIAPEDMDLRPMGVASPVPEEYFERFADILPRSILYIWRRLGFDGFGDGVFWITDPIVWAPVVQEWLSPVEDRLPITDTWYCLARNAMGYMFLWGEDSGDCLQIDPIYNKIAFNRLTHYTRDQTGARERAGRVMFGGKAFNYAEEPEGDDGKPLPAQALERLGPVDAGQVYGFVLPPVMGGAISVDNLRVVDAYSYLTLQAQQGDITISDPVDANWEQVAPIIGADPDASPIDQTGES